VSRNAVRRKSQVDLPRYPTTSIGSFPQTNEVRAARRKLNDNQLSAEDYERFIEKQIAKTIALQEEIASTCWCTASSSATTWSSISASSSRDLRSPSTAGSSRTGRATSNRRSSSVTSHGRGR